MSNEFFSGPKDFLGPGLHSPTRGVWITSGRAAVIESDRDLLLIDPGDEPILRGSVPIGPLADLLRVSEMTGKALERILITHAHQDHIANLPPLLDYLAANSQSGAPLVVAHENSPVEATVRIAERTTLDEVTGLTGLPLLGHSPWGDDLAFFHPGARILFSGDIAQPKGECWEETFYPSPYPYFTDGDVYVRSLDLLLSLDFDILVTGHREVRVAPLGRRWLELTRRAILRVGEEVFALPEGRDPLAAGRDIYGKLCRERGIGPETVAARMNPPGSSAFDRFDMPGILFYWRKRFGSSHG